MSNSNTNTGGSNWRATRSGGTIASIEKVFHFADFAGSMAFAQDAMKKDAMGKESMSQDGMKKETMAKDGMKKDAMAKDEMKK